MRGKAERERVFVMRAWLCVSVRPASVRAAALERAQSLEASASPPPAGRRLAPGRVGVSLLVALRLYLSCRSPKTLEAVAFSIACECSAGSAVHMQCGAPLPGPASAPTHRSTGAPHLENSSCGIIRAADRTHTEGERTLSVPFPAGSSARENEVFGPPLLLCQALTDHPAPLVGRPS